MAANTEQQTEMHTQSTDVRARLAADPENTQVALVVELDELTLVDGTDTQLALDGGDQRRSLEQGTSEGLEGTGELCLATGELVVQSDDGNIFLSGALLGLDETGGAVDADDEAPRDLGIEGTTVASFLDTTWSASPPSGVDTGNAPKHTLHPGDDLVTRRVRGLVEVDDTGADVLLEVSLERRAPIGDRREVTGADVHYELTRQQDPRRDTMDARLS